MPGMPPRLSVIYMLSMASVYVCYSEIMQIYKIPLSAPYVLNPGNQ